MVESVKNGNETLSYTYDDVGNITEVKKDGTTTESYSYDNLNQLISATYGGHNYTYSYDNGGNITVVKKDGNQIKSYTYGDTDWKDLLTAYNGQTISHDPIGNPEQYRDGFSFTWQNGRQLSSIAKGTDNISYLYDSDGHRTRKTVNGTITDYYWLNGILLGQKTGSEYILFLYDENGTAYGILIKNGANETYYYYIFNAQGDVIGIVDNNGALVASYEYDAWGKVSVTIRESISDDFDVTRHIGNINPIRYRGYYYDQETQFYYLQSRYYDPEIGRFISADSVISGSGQSIQGYNLFEYCNNNPINKSDSTGNWPKWVKKVASAITKSVKKVASVVTNAMNSIKSSFSPANHVKKTHVTTPTAMLNLGTLFGKVGFSSTVTKQNKEPGLVHSASDIGNDASKYSAGINIVGWFGADVGVSSEINAFVSAQVTPWVHGEVSAGIDGIGAVIGFDVGDTSFDFELKGGWGLIAIFVAPQLITSGGQPSTSPAY